MSNYTVKVKPGSSQEKIVRTDNVITAYIHAHAHDGEANKALIKLLAKYFDVSKSQIEIVRGEKSRNKLIAVHK